MQMKTDDSNTKPLSKWLLPLILVLLGSGCSTVEKGKRYGDAPLKTFKTAYVVMTQTANWDIGMYIREALADRGVDVTAGRMQDKPADVAFYVTYVDRRKWDVAMYLDSLEIQFSDGATGKLLASGSFRNRFFHSFPNERQKTIEVINTMYEAK